MELTNVHLNLTLTKEDLIALILGIKPNSSIFKHDLIRRHGFYMNFHAEWFWVIRSLNECSEEELHEIYKLCQKSWRNK